MVRSGGERRGFPGAQIAKRLHAHQAEKLPQEKGLVVRSIWQHHPLSEEDAVQDTPPSFHFGTANVSDRPLSAGEGSSSGARETVVISKGARENLGRAG